MSRLTERNDKGGAYYVCFERCKGDPTDCYSCDMMIEHCEALAVYEEINLTPDQIRHIRLENVHLSEKLIDAYKKMREQEKWCRNLANRMFEKQNELIEEKKQAIENIKESIKVNHDGKLVLQGNLKPVTVDMAIEALEKQDKYDWIPVEYHYIKDDERKKEGYPEEWVYCIDSPLPNNGQEILITTKAGYVKYDTCDVDDRYYLESGRDWVEDVVAWMPLPEAYEAEEQTNDM